MRITSVSWFGFFSWRVCDISFRAKKSVHTLPLVELTDVSGVERWRLQIQELLVWWGSFPLFPKKSPKQKSYKMFPTNSSNDVELCVIVISGGEVSFDLKNDGPTLTGARATFSINLNFPPNQTVLSDGQVVWSQNCTVNGKMNFRVVEKTLWGH